MTGPGQQSVESYARVARILWIAFLFSMIVHGVVPRFVPMEGEPTTGLDLIFWTVAGLLALGALGYRKWAFSDDALRRAVGMTPGSAPVTDAASRERRQLALAQLALRHQIVVLAILDGISVLGLVHAFLAKDPSAALSFAGVALALALTSYPRVTEVVERSRAWG
ncbi:MAG: hypothetical protein R3E97_01485 [Candidatus Eisenbacteria bacterium]